MKWSTSMSRPIRLSRLALLSAAVALMSMPSSAQQAPAGSSLATATFAGGCFWCMEPPFDDLDGVVSTTSGYIGGTVPNPTYEQVSSGRTGHIEALQIKYDPARVSYERLLQVYWRNIDALDAGGQFCDRGSQYASAIFYHSDEQRDLAARSKERIAAQLGKPVATTVVRADTFYPAEAYHQDYYRKNPVRYKFYKWNCGRQQRLDKLWGKQ